jgi:putative membrane protein
MQRSIKDYLVIGLKGMAMGAADAVPGVSGGTIAFISGIYEELITTISNIDINLLKTIPKEGFAVFWSKLNGNFLVALLCGIIVSFVTFMQLAKYLIENQPVLIWSFFFGLIIASIYFIGKQIKKWNLPVIISLILGAAVAFYISTLPPLSSNSSSWFLLFAGAIAICAMILPGISGSFILLILGAYKTLSDAIHDLDFKKIALFAVGAVVGLLSFSRVLKWLFKNYHNSTLAVLTGFIFGSLNKVWPWKITERVWDRELGKEMNLSEITEFGTLAIFQKDTQDFETLKVISEKSVMPNQYAELNQGLDPQLFWAISLMIVGFLTIFLLEKFGSKEL